MTPGALDFSVLAPLGFVALGAMGALLFEALVTPRAAAGPPPSPAHRALRRARLSGALAAIASLSLLLAIYTAGWMFLRGSAAPFNALRPMLVLDPLACFAIVLIAVGALLSVWLSVTYLPAMQIDFGEYYALLLLSCTGMFVFVSAVDWMTLYLGLELTSLPLYALAGFHRRRLRSNESALKYFLTGAFASAILLYGVALLYGAVGTTSFAGLRSGFAQAGGLATAGLALVVVGMVFKVAAVPFHSWAPDVYEGAPTSVVAFMAVTVKVAGFVVLMRVLLMALPEVDVRVEGLLWLLALLSMVVGSFMAVIQTRLKRLLGWSAVAHAGTLLIGLAAGTPEALAAVLFYLFVYVFTILGAFGVIAALAWRQREHESVDDFSGLATSRPAVAALMTLFLVSLAGIPGTAGFMAKFHLFLAAVRAGEVVLVVVGVLTSVVSLVYYLQVPRVMYMRDGPAGGERIEIASSDMVVLCLCAAAVLYFAFFPQGDPWQSSLRVLDWAARAVAFPSG